MRAIRGAICAPANSREAIYRATQHLLGAMAERNGLTTDEIVAAFFTMTPDLDAEFPAYAARDMGWTDVAMLGAQETLVPGGLPRTIRVLLLAVGADPARHVYLGQAARMRSDLVEPGDAEAWDGEARVEATARSERMGTLLVVGLGLIGGSLAGAARRAGIFETVRGHDRDREALAMARRRGLIDEGSDDLRDAVAAADMLVLATPVEAIAKTLEGVARDLKPAAVVTDVGSTKRAIVAAMDRLGPRVRAVGGHPMAGDTRTGPEAARLDLFQGARWALIPLQSADVEAKKRVERLVRAVGAEPLWTTAESHDRVVAGTSHLPAAMAVALVQQVAGLSELGLEPAALVGPGFVDASRLAAGDPEMTAQMLATNASEFQSSIDGLIESLREIGQLATTDRGALARRLEEARTSRASLVGNWGSGKSGF
ncbi:MAG: chorismate mutase [Gemmatimonadetes bacterium]|uniref:chorismate mutase n=1 Tax=Candidatus Kutchimonas denitrificans TaxID=3056748 RepID=A0AAE4Z8D1_9BACT|nr:chorismate mutase [Gemmatimonadota bacterium]NIR75548.1 chorismate mutase [Candidatus Kutchimonas denitrificans]NIS01862.1 chorismate mutase [Gemmatimonadota bacterium]NIT67643.1 chorismate mutase [Gemmatimonadota bacterium]NIU53517.1 chorismate mutase [Gemmatimonadota bacterium]